MVVQDGDLADMLSDGSARDRRHRPRTGNIRARALRSLRPDQDARVVVLSDRSDGSLVLEAMRRGVFAFLRKPDGLHDLSEVLARVASGERVLPPDLELSAVEELPGSPGERRRHPRCKAYHAPRAGDLRVARRGLHHAPDRASSRISPRTVETHSSKLYRKLGAKTRIQAIARAASLGLLDLDR